MFKIYSYIVFPIVIKLIVFPFSIELIIMITKNNGKIPGFLFGISSRGCCVVVVVVEVVVVGGGGGVKHAERKDI